MDIWSNNFSEVVEDIDYVCIAKDEDNKMYLTIACASLSKEGFLNWFDEYGTPNVIAYAPKINNVSINDSFIFN